MRGYFNASKMHWLVITLSSFSTLFFKNTSFERHVANRIWQQDEKCIIVGARRDTIFLQLSSISLKFLVISNSRTIILLHCKYWMNITPWASLKSLVKPCNQIIYVCLDLYQRITTSHDVTFSRIQSRNFEILKRCYIKFGTICKYDLCCIWKLFGNKKESLPILATFVWTRYLVQTPGRLGSAHPMPQLMMPARNQRLSSLLWTTRGPPESPWGEKILGFLT